MRATMISNQLGVLPSGDLGGHSSSGCGTDESATTPSWGEQVLRSHYEAN